MTVNEPKRYVQNELCDPCHQAIVNKSLYMCASTHTCLHANNKSDVLEKPHKTKWLKNKQCRDYVLMTSTWVPIPGLAE